jgi:hypothetical protein
MFIAVALGVFPEPNSNVNQLVRAAVASQNCGVCRTQVAHSWSQLIPVNS